VKKGLLHPERIEARCVLAHQIARIRQCPNISSQVRARLPETRGVKAKPLPLDHPVEINVDSSAKPLPSRLSLLKPPARIGL